MKTVGERIRQARDARGLSGEELAHAVGYKKIPIPLHGMEDGAVFLPDGLTTSQWAYALKITKFLIENYRDEGNAPATQKEPS